MFFINELDLQHNVIWFQVYYVSRCCDLESLPSELKEVDELAKFKDLLRFFGKL